VDWQNRAHFIGVAAQMMRRILVDHARAHARSKRGGEQIRVPLEEASLCRAAGWRAVGFALLVGR
jgi:hypothetical protein